MHESFGFPIVSPTVDSPPEARKRYIQTLYDVGEALPRADAALLDSLLIGAPATTLEAQHISSHRELRKRYPGEEPWDGTKPYIWTPYDNIFAILRALKLKQGDVFYDLGSGYGRVVLCAGILTPADARGIELVEERALLAERAKVELNLGNVVFIHGNVLDRGLTDGTVFYLYAPFHPRTLERVLLQLKDVARLREDRGLAPIRVVSRVTAALRYQEWLQELEPQPQKGIRIFRSLPQHDWPV